MTHRYPLLFALCCVLFSCVSVPDLLLRGEDNRAYALASQRVAAASPRKLAPGKRRYDQFLDAYYATQIEDLDEIDRLERSSDPARHGPRFGAYARLYARSGDLVRLAPATATFARYPRLAPAALRERREAARRQAAHYYEGRIEALLPAAARGEKPAARAAYDLHDTLNYLLPLRAVYNGGRRKLLWDLGTLRAWVYAGVGPGQNELQLALNKRRPERLNWTEITFDPAPEQRIDRNVETTVVDRSAFNRGTECTSREYEREILDHVERRKVKEKVNDSTWMEKIIEIKHYRTIFATVTDYEQRADAEVVFRADVYPPEAREPEFSFKRTARFVWRHTYSQVAGDRRAVIACPIEDNPRYAPSAERMIQRATANIPGLMVTELLRRYEPYGNPGEPCRAVFDPFGAEEVERGRRR